MYFGTIVAFLSENMFMATANDADGVQREVFVYIPTYRSYPDNEPAIYPKPRVGDRIAMRVYNAGGKAMASKWCYRDEVDDAHRRLLLQKKPTHQPSAAAAK